MDGKEKVQGMEELTHPKAYYEFFDKYYHRNRMIAIYIGLGLLLLTGVTGFVGPVRNFVIILWGEDFLRVVWPAVLLAGAGLLVALAVVAPKYHNITLFPDGIALAGKEGKVQIPFSKVYAVMEYEKNGKRWTNLYVYGQQRPTRWSNRQLRDYRRCLGLMEKLRADYLLGRDFPENFSQLELLLAENLNLTGGELYYNGVRIEPVGFLGNEFEQVIVGAPDVVLMNKDGGKIALPPERIGNRTALLRVLEYYTKQKRNET